MVVSSRQLRVPFEVVCLLGAVRSSEMKVMFFFFPSDLRLHLCGLSVYKVHRKLVLACLGSYLLLELLSNARAWKTNPALIASCY